MDYTELTKEFLQQMRISRKYAPHQKIHESMRGEVFVLHHIAQRTEQIIPSEIADAMGLSGARIAATLNSLEKKGYINRQIDPSDRRRILVTLTDEGREQEGVNQRKLFESTERMLRFLGEHDAKEYIRITRRMNDFAQSDES
jgi:DNA-binding MarR family transcriptional regulator